jgi:C1A family cysteine protease
MPHSKRVYGWHPSNRESVHPRYQLPEHHQGVDALPASVDLEPQCPPVYDQGQLGSCTANALAALFQFLLIKLGKPSFIPSRLMIYWGEREIEGTIDEDAGADGDDGVTFLQTKGVCPETTWPYDPTKFTMVGYDDARQQFKIRNSWGPDWGLAGYFWMPYPYATNPKLASDFCSATLAS